ncbi:short-chain fatty acid transporter [Pseudogracilibacillus auburnensis]|uniref:Short-chain fatty acids transporter n=1 Tax=Pseudogracilibacillus auburnensis TaxID=1494959 RepID=A0A2V3VXF5_9BACI|nr:short-chain fatty acid transporter [Pseudogracilibacillus auburnensis]MBO1002296.1 short-chain fatty acid transporter [Pseudogracilibacillus auburnensis]PXW86316.1 short-chain fatty acids transporter [Pseudogracilibacillus auburnensis]
MKSITNFFDRIVQRYLPDAFLFAVILTIIVFIMGIFMTGSSPIQMVEHWGTGFWDLLAFSMQMALIVVTGYVLANTPVVKTALEKTSMLAKTPGQAILLVTFVASIASLINYGFGLVVGALLALQVVKRVPSVDYRLLVASAYSGFLLWHGGLSGSIPLLIATPDHFLQDTIGTIPVTETMFSSYNLFIVFVLLFTLPFLNRMLMKSREGMEIVNPVDWETSSFEDKYEEVEKNERQTPSERLENSQIISMLIGLLGLAFIIYHFATNGFDLNINLVNLIMLFLGILLHRTPRRFLHSVNNAVKNVGGIIVQFPFYAGIMGMMVDSGLSEQMSLWFVSISTEFTFPLFTFISAGLVNFFVPSGGGQWAVQGPIMIPAGIEIGVDSAKTAMAVAWGDAWTNMIQPFWALPLLAIAGLKVRDIMGFCVIILIYSFFPIAIGLLFF